jgi:hypothetical protein
MKSTEFTQKDRKKSTIVGLVIVALIVALCVTFVNLSRSNAAPVTFGYTGAPQEYTVPTSGWYKLEVWGAEGADVTSNSDTYLARSGGKGGYSYGAKYLTAGQKLYVYVGEKRATANKAGTAANSDAPRTATWNGGGGGGNRPNQGSGGGATDIRTTNLTNPLEGLTGVPGTDPRIITAGGGGGATSYPQTNTTYTVTGGAAAGVGGAGGGVNGQACGAAASGTPAGNFVCSGGTQTAGGVGSTSTGCSDSKPGGAGYGGDAYTLSWGGGGGGGWWGGASGGCYSNEVASGAGGSSNLQGVQTYVGATTAIDANMVANNNLGAGHATITFLEEGTPQVNTDSQTVFTSNAIAGANNGSIQSWTAPKRGIYRIETWGAEGGPLSATEFFHGSIGGEGGYSAGDIPLAAGQTLYFAVGGHGFASQFTNDQTGGWNGGGRISSTATQNTSGGGGGATDVRLMAPQNPTNPLDANELLSRIMVAGGGGGGDDGPNNTRTVASAGISNDGSGGAGGGLHGQPPLINGRIQGDELLTTCAAATDASGTTAQAEGTFKTWSNQCQGYRFAVGEVATFSSDIGGGGGGWWGGKTSNNNNGGGAGGSSFISGMPGAIGRNAGTHRTALTGASCAGTGALGGSGNSEVGCNESLSGFKFYNPKMIDGANCEWSNGVREMPYPTTNATTVSAPNGTASASGTTPNRWGVQTDLTVAVTDPDFINDFNNDHKICTGPKKMPDPFSSGMLRTWGKTGDGAARITLVSEIPDPDFIAGDIESKGLNEKSIRVDFGAVETDYTKVFDVLKDDNIPEADLKLDVSSSNVSYDIYFSDSQACINTIKGGGSTACTDSGDNNSGVKSGHGSGQKILATISGLDADKEYFFTVRATVTKGLLKDAIINYASTSASTLAVGDEDPSCSECRVY